VTEIIIRQLEALRISYFLYDEQKRQERRTKLRNNCPYDKQAKQQPTLCSQRAKHSWARKKPSIRHDIKINKSREIIKMWVDPESVTPTSTRSRNCLKGPLIDCWLNTPPVVADRRDVLLLPPSIPVTGIDHSKRQPTLWHQGTTNWLLMWSTKQQLGWAGIKTMI
jgi:hypothetical protein